MPVPVPNGFKGRARRSLNHVLGNPFLKILFPVLVAAGIFLIITPASWYGTWFSPRISGIGTLINSVVILVPSFFFFTKPDEDLLVAARKQRALTKFQNYIATVVLLALSGAIGLFGLYHYWSFLQYDKLLHFVDPFLLTVGLSGFIYHWYDISIVRAVTVAALIMATLNIGWELVEYFSDKLFGTMMFGQDGQNAAWDTATDLLLDFASILTAVLIVKNNTPPTQ